MSSPVNADPVNADPVNADPVNADPVNTDPVNTEPQTGSPSPAPPEKGSAWAALRPLLLRLHFYAGLLVAPFLMVAALTGLLYAASFQLEKIVHSHELSVPAQKTTVPLSEQVAAAQRSRPGERVIAVRPAPEPGTTTRVLFALPDGDSGTSLAVFVDPHNGEVRGTLESYGSSGALPLRAWISSLHRHLHLGEPGRIYSELAASWLWVVALGGLLLWLSRRRARRGADRRANRRARSLLLPERGVTGRRRTLSWHGSVGVWALLGLLFLSATGLTWSKYAGVNVDAVRAAFGWQTPSISAASSDHGGHGDSHGGHDHHSAPADDAGTVERVAGVAAARGMSGPLEIVVPPDADTPSLVKQIDKVWPTRLDQITVDAHGQVVAELKFDDYPLMAKLVQWTIDTHMGIMFGLVNQVVLGLLAVGLMWLIVLGYRMWWLRRPTRGRTWSFGRPYPRGGWRAVPWPILAVLAVAAIAVGYALPLLGVSLLVFLAVDVLLGLRNRRNATTDTHPSSK
ncbi:Uncharacterized iron-regulated membrane protein [Sinosporangium album]|uniref:Uncharacterized iron-regulated membrane protein n=1 Tax=Sinosporangium album TaxID=504805 RepID=A0A1G8CNM7_9ACTN|nr:PepSY domain-containing protein [Sinosporangium album]SDH46942.1 Uncharacterized iron-regulated membrane protein [Sinosporangium album]